MTRLLPLLLLSIASFCAHAQYREPSLSSSAVVEFYQQDFERQVIGEINKTGWNNTSKTSAGELTIPVVVHVLQGKRLQVEDEDVVDMIDNINGYLLKQRPDTADIINKYKAVAVSTNIKLKLATIDPNGKRTRGIDRTTTYLTWTHDGFLSQSKINQWPPNRYLNIWIADDLRGAAGFAFQPGAAAAFPFWDGIMILDNYMGSPFTPYEVARYLGLTQPCDGNTCLDADRIPDTPPCYYNANATCSNVFDTTCDTPNIQNIMYNPTGPCALMFTRNQAQFMQEALRSTVGDRNNLVSATNAATTGINLPIPDLPPVPDYEIGIGYANRRFGPIGQPVSFYDISWNDTVTARSWSFSGDPVLVRKMGNSITNYFTAPGWVSLSLTVTGNNTGSATLTDPHAYYAADTIPITAEGYLQDFEPTGDGDKWPCINYYNNAFKWQPAGVGYLDNYSMMYVGFDPRTTTEKQTGTPQGDYDDLITPAFDLSTFGDSCYFNFMSAGASATFDQNLRRDSLVISYSTDMGYSWTKLGMLTAKELCNIGAVPDKPYAPTSASHWLQQSIPIPTNVRGKKVIVSLRYHPGADNAGISTGNNLFLDKFEFNRSPVSGPFSAPKIGFKVFPNPAHGTLTFLLEGIPNTTATMVNMHGQVVKSVALTNGNNVVSISDLPAGIYIIKCNGYIIKISKI